MMNRASSSALIVALALSGCGSDDSSGGSGGQGGTAGTAGSAGAAGSAGSAGSGGTTIDGLLALEPGEAAELAPGTTRLWLATPGGTEQFVLVVASTDFESATTMTPYSLALGGPGDGASATLLTGCSLTSDAWSQKPLPAETPPSGTGAAVGTTRTISIGSPSGAQAIEAEVVAAGTHTTVWADITPANPAVLDPAVVQEFLTDFETIILPRARTIFGMESDMDGDGHVQLVFSPVTYQTAVAFFSGCDLSAPSVYCPASNQGEYLYLTPPNAIQPPYNTPNAIKEILAHELSHMIHFNRKVLKNQLSGWLESAYMIEGVGALAQDVLGYQAGNLYVTLAGLDGIDQFSLTDALKNDVEYDLARDGVLRGASYLLARFLYDRAGGDLANGDNSVENRGGPALLRTLLDAPESMADRLPQEAGASTEDLALDFWTSLAISNRETETGVAAKNPCFAFLPTADDPVTTRQRGANLFASFHGQQMSGPALQIVGAEDGNLRSGGAELILLEPSGGPELTAELTLDPAALPRVRVVRIR